MIKLTCSLIMKVSLKQLDTSHFVLVTFKWNFCFLHHLLPSLLYGSPESCFTLCAAQIGQTSISTALWELMWEGWLWHTFGNSLGSHSWEKPKYFWYLSFALLSSCKMQKATLSVETPPPWRPWLCLGSETWKNRGKGCSSFLVPS